MRDVYFSAEDPLGHASDVGAPRETASIVQDITQRAAGITSEVGAHEHIDVSLCSSRRRSQQQDHCGERHQTNDSHVFAPPKTNVSLVYFAGTRTRFDCRKLRTMMRSSETPGGGSFFGPDGPAHGRGDGNDVALDAREVIRTLE